MNNKESQWDKLKLEREAFRQAMMSSNVPMHTQWDKSADSIQKDDATFLQACGIKPFEQSEGEQE